MTRTALTTVETWDTLWTAPSNRLINRCKSHLRHAKTWRRLLARFLDAPGVAGPIDVLELGCAPGQMLLQLHQLRPANHYHGIDMAPDGLALAHERLRAAGVPAGLHLGDIRHARVPPADLVVSFGLVEHFTDTVEIIRHHRRFLRPGGVAAVSVPNYAHPLVVSLLTRFSQTTLDTHYLGVMSSRALHAAFAEAGFTEIRTGSTGSPLIPSSSVRPGLAGSSYRFAARGWNLCASLGLDSWPWPSHIWAMGVSPD